MMWVTWENVGIDRMACGWLIRRFIDAEATFCFVTQGSMEFPSDATPFDVPGARLSHHRGHCSFVAFLKEYKLRDPALERLAEVIDGADIPGDLALVPESAGVDAVCRGLRRICISDDEALQRSSVILDALYAEFQDEGRPGTEV